MKVKPLFLITICLLVGCVMFLMLKQQTDSGNAPKPEITMVNFPTGITNTLLNVSATSFTFSVEWPLVMDL